MPEITVCIEMDTDTGQISVGMEPEEQEQQSPSQASPSSQMMGMTDLSKAGGEEETEKSYMKPVKSIDEALSVAADLLKNAGQVQASAAQGPDQQSAADAAFKTQRGSMLQ
jgi:hypothetical protein